MTDTITAGSFVRWTMCMQDPRETVVVRGRVRTIHGRRFADVEVGDLGVDIRLPYADLTRIEPGPRGSAEIIPFCRQPRRNVDVGGMMLTPGPRGAA